MKNANAPGGHHLVLLANDLWEGEGPTTAALAMEESQFEQQLRGEAPVLKAKPRGTSGLDTCERTIST